MDRDLAVAVLNEIPGDFEFRDEAPIRDAHWNVGTGDVVIDVGCGYGSYTIPALDAGATVYAVDANQSVLGALVDRARHRPGNLTPLHVALYHGGRYPQRLMKQIAATGWVDLAPAETEWATLDDLVTMYELERLDWVKIDVEGGELGVLRGGLKALRRWRPQLVIEDHSTVYSWVRQIKSRQRIADMLASLGYNLQLVPYEGPGPDRDYFVAACET